MRAGWYRIGVSAAVLVVSLLVAGPALAVTITNFTPTTDFIPEVANACVGTSVTINGSGFVNDGGPVTVAFNGKPGVDVLIGSDSVIYAKMPGGTTAGNITVTTAKGTATSTATFNPTPCAADNGPSLIAKPTPAVTVAKPVVSGVSPKSGAAGTTVTLTGSHLTGATSVKFKGVAAKFKVVSASKITATVPAGAKTGRISVTTPGGTTLAAGASFVVK